MASNDKTDSGDAPLIDLNEASIKKLIARAKRRGIITYDELNEALPQDQMSSEQIEDIMAAISEMGVNIVESDEDAVDPEEREPAQGCRTHPRAPGGRPALREITGGPHPRGCRGGQAQSGRSVPRSDRECPDQPR
jgi:hypothetical protein